MKNQKQQIDLTYCRSSDEISNEEYNDNEAYTKKLIEDVVKKSQISPAMTSIYLYKNQLNSKIFTKLIDSFAKLSSLNELIFAENNLTNQEATSIAKVIQKNKSLTDLYIREKKITDEGIADIFMAISHNKALENLALVDMPLSIYNIRILHDAIQNKESLKTIRLYHCNIDDEGAITIADAITHIPSLTLMRLDSNPIPQATIKYINELTTEHQLHPNVATKSHKLYLAPLAQKTTTLCIDAAIYDDDYSLAFDNLAKTISNNLLPLTKSIKIADTAIDTLRFFHHPSYENSREVLIDVNQLFGMYYGNNIYLRAIILFNALENVQQGEYSKAIQQSLESIAFASASHIIASSEIYGAILAGYGLYQLGCNAYEFYQEIFE
jgi:hypothetical protein